MRIKIIQVGSTKDDYLKDGTIEILKRLSAYADVEVVNLKESAVTKTHSKDQAIAEEAEQILKRLKNEEFKIVLDERGEALDSMKFSEMLKENFDQGISICFVIGGPFGLSSEVKAKADLVLSFSKMTFTHQMIRIFLLEQIYRAICIIKGKEYHH